VKTKRLARAGLAAGLVCAFAAQSLAQTEAVQNRIHQQVIINGQRVSGAHVTAANGGIQTFACPEPQRYVTPDGSSQGWACFDSATGVWLLNALAPAGQSIPEAPVSVQQPPTVIYQQPPTVIYQQPIPATVVYTTPAPVVVAPVYSPAVVLGAAAIDATGRIVSAAIRSSRYPRVYYVQRGHERW
jgi:hypothetical protein